MRREGRQHGFVRCYVISPTPSSYRRYVKTVDPASVAGLFTKVSRKPTNQSKFTGKCGRARCVDCHIRPVSKSKEKAKGNMKLRSIGSDAGSIRYPAGTSAAGVLDDLAIEAFHDDIEYYEYLEDYYDRYVEFDWSKCICEYCCGNGRASIETEDQIGDELEDDSMWGELEDDCMSGEDEEDCMSYCDVGLCWGEGDADEYGDDGWYFVGHIEQ